MAFKMYVDQNGVPYSDYGTYNSLSIGRQTSILSVAERGIWYFDTFRMEPYGSPVLLSYDWTRHPTNRKDNPVDETEARCMLVNCADWLLMNIRDFGRFSAWVYPYPFSFATKAGWLSSQAQAVGIQLLLRTASMTGKLRYSDPIERLLNAFEVDIEDGGLVAHTEKGNIWFEKVAQRGNQQPKVLNGLLFTILGLTDISARLSNERAKKFADAGILAAAELLPKFDLGDWSAYDIFGKRASPHYHRIHIEQLKRLAPLYPDLNLNIYLNKFILYQSKSELARPSGK
jgi:heparosan-N-sulfate-glucuronate 5-epimerase